MVLPGASWWPLIYVLRSLVSLFISKDTSVKSVSLFIISLLSRTRTAFDCVVRIVRWPTATHFPAVKEQDEILKESSEEGGGVEEESCDSKKVVSADIARLRAPPPAA